VFFSEEVVVDASAESAGHALTRWLAVGGSSPAASASVAVGGPVVVRAGFAGLTKTIEVHAMPSRVRDGVTVVPLRWSATGPTGDMFPTLDANLEITPLDPHRSRVALVGSYRPPLGPMGTVLDQTALRHAARATIRHWLAQAREVVGANPTDT
jgi:hypothetical protein